MKEHISHARSSYFETGAVHFSLRERSNWSDASTWSRNYKIKPEAHFFSIRDPSPPSVYLRDKMDQAFPLCFCILQAIKNWIVGRPVNEAINLAYTLVRRTCNAQVHMASKKVLITDLFFSWRRHSWINKRTSIGTDDIHCRRRHCS